MKRKGVGGLLAFLIISVGAFLAVLGLGYKPLLGLDLQGGVSVVLQPANEVDSDQLDQAIDIIRSRVDALGVAEPDISRQGDTILVQLPGVDNQTRALDLVGQTAERRFRPVCAVLEPDVNAPAAQSPSTTVPADGATTTAPSGATTTVPTTGSSATDTTETGLAPSGAFGQGESAAGLQTDTTDTSAPAITDAPGDTSSTTAPSPATTVPAASPDQAASGCTTPPTDLNRNGITRRVDDKASDSVVLPEVDPDCDADPADPAKCWVARYWLGPTALKGDALSDASATFPNNEWVVNPVFKSGEDGIDKFNAAAAECNSASPNCPTTQLAIVLDGIVISAPQINEPQFQGHFPAKPILPGVLVVEAMAQASAVLVGLSMNVIDRDLLTYFMSIEGCKFRRMVVPGDVLELHMTVKRGGGKIWKFHGLAKVGEEVACEAEITAMMHLRD